MDPVDREIESALAVDPSPEFLARVRERIANEPEPALWRHQWLLMWAGAVAMTVAIVAIGVAVGRVDKRASQTPADRALLAPAPSVSASSPGPVAEAPRTTRRRPTRLRTDPEVLTAASEARGLRDLFAAVREGRVEFAFPVEDVSYAAQESRPVSEIVISPIAIEPLDPAATSEGALH